MENQTISTESTSEVSTEEDDASTSGIGEKEAQNRETEKVQDDADVESDDDEEYEVILIGAGAAGIGLAAALLSGYMDTENLLILEQGPSIGTSFRQWHKFTRFISPSWLPAFPYGVQDLNTIVPDTSIMMSTSMKQKKSKDKKEGMNNNNMATTEQHPTGDDYADYLEEQAEKYAMNIAFHQQVTKIEYKEDSRHFVVSTKKATTKTKETDSQEEEEETVLRATCVVWCGGEWSYPASVNPAAGGAVLGKESDGFLLEEGCAVHYKDLVLQDFVNNKEKEDNNEKSSLAASSNLPIVVVGLGEAGADTACALAEQGCSVVLLDGKDPHQPERSGDPSCRLSPKSLNALFRYRDQIEIRQGVRCMGVTRKNKRISRGEEEEEESGNNDDTGLLLQVQLSRPFAKTSSSSGDENKNEASKDNDSSNNTTDMLYTRSKVVYCNGFDISQNPVIRDLFHWRDDGYPQVDKACDESTRTPNLFLAGPMLRHDIQTSCSSTDDDGGGGCQTAVFCFIYKFRTRFAVVAQEIIRRVIQERYTMQLQDLRSGEKDDDGEDAPVLTRVTREGQMWKTAAESMQKHYQSKGMYLADINEACGLCG